MSGFRTLRLPFVLEHGRLVGVITRKTLVREVVATGRDPRTTTLRDIAEEPVATIESDMLLTEAFHVLNAAYRLLADPAGLTAPVAPSAIETRRPSPSEIRFRTILLVTPRGLRLDRAA